MIAMPALIAGLLVLACALTVGAFGLPLSKMAVAAWIRLYTWWLPPDVRERRRAELQSDVFEQHRADLAEGYKPEAIALRILLRSAGGAHRDISWSVQEGRAARRSPLMTPEDEDALWSARLDFLGERYRERMRRRIATQRAREAKWAGSPIGRVWLPVGYVLLHVSRDQLLIMLTSVLLAPVGYINSSLLLPPGSEPDIQYYISAALAIGIGVFGALTFLMTLIADMRLTKRQAAKTD